MKSFFVAWLASLIAPVLLVFFVINNAYEQDGVIILACFLAVIWGLILVARVILKNKYPTWGYFLFPLLLGAALVLALFLFDLYIDWSGFQFI